MKPLVEGMKHPPDQHFWSSPNGIRTGVSTLRGRLHLPLESPAVTRGVVGNESTGVTFSVSAAARQPASSSLLGPTSFVSAPSLSVS